MPAFARVYQDQHALNPCGLCCGEVHPWRRLTLALAFPLIPRGAAGLGFAPGITTVAGHLDRGLSLGGRVAFRVIASEEYMAPELRFEPIGFGPTLRAGLA